MALIYFLLWVWQFLVPVAGLLLLWCGGAWLTRRGAKGWLISGVVVLVLSVVPLLPQRLDHRAAANAVAAYETRPSRLDLPAGPVLYLGNCGTACFGRPLPAFASALDTARGPADWPRTGGPTIDLHTYLDGTAGSGPVPYTYILHEMPAWELAFYLGYGETLDHGHWHRKFHTVYTLARIPADGIYDPIAPEILYRRFVLQDDVRRWPFWPNGATTRQMPEIDEFFDELIEISAP